MWATIGASPRIACWATCSARTLRTVCQGYSRTPRRTSKSREAGSPLVQALAFDRILHELHGARMMLRLPDVGEFVDQRIRDGLSPMFMIWMALPNGLGTASTKARPLAPVLSDADTEKNRCCCHKRPWRARFRRPSKASPSAGWEAEGRENDRPARHRRLGRHEGGTPWGVAGADDPVIAESRHRRWRGRWSEQFSRSSVRRCRPRSDCYFSETL